MKFRITPDRLEVTMSFLDFLLGRKSCGAKVDVKSLARCAGLLCSLSRAVGPCTRLYTRSLYTAVAMSPSWFAWLPIMAEVERELLWWRNFMPTCQGFPIRGDRTVIPITYDVDRALGYDCYLEGDYRICCTALCPRQVPRPL
jgi:hypothetical protein